MPHWGFWELLAYAGIWVSAIILATDAGLKMAPDLRKKCEPIIANPIWGFTPLVLLTISGAIFLGREIGLIGGAGTSQRLQEVITQTTSDRDDDTKSAYNKICF